MNQRDINGFHRFQGGDSLGGDDLVGNFFLEAKRSAFMIHQPAMCDQATTKE